MNGSVKVSGTGINDGGLAARDAHFIDGRVKR